MATSPAKPVGSASIRPLTDHNPQYGRLCCPHFKRRRLPPPAPLLPPPAVGTCRELIVHLATSPKGLSIGSMAGPSSPSSPPSPPSPPPSSSSPLRPFLPLPAFGAALRFLPLLLPSPTASSSFSYISRMAFSRMSKSEVHICWMLVRFTFSNSALFSLAILSNSSFLSFVSDAICMINRYSKPVLGGVLSPNFWNLNLVKSLTTSTFFRLLMFNFLEMII
mmetsp:Transcript_46499/g.119514  ORF Transcript_46499/g.119514 Transcript_46499/m.119514 type:complete len:221 (-) Transcript_46499:1730-2392(-)